MDINPTETTLISTWKNHHGGNRDVVRLLDHQRTSALSTEPASFNGRTRVPEIALNNPKVNNISTPQIFQVTTESYTMDPIQRCMESAVRRANANKSPFPHPSTEVTALNSSLSLFVFVTSSW